MCVRGGYCWQTNGILAAALLALDYNLYEGPARVVGYVNCWTSTYDEAARAQQAARDQVPCLLCWACTHACMGHGFHYIHYIWTTPGVCECDQVAFKGVGHMVLLVKGPEDGQRWMLDTGFGGHSPPHPIRLQAPFSDTSNGALPRHESLALSCQ